MDSVQDSQRALEHWGTNVVRVDDMVSYLPKRDLTPRGNSFWNGKCKLTTGFLDKRMT